MRLRTALAAILCSLWAGMAAVQERPATLLADAVRVEGRDVLIAEGQVEVLFEDRRLRATRVVYDRRTDRIDIAGPIRIDDGDGVILVAEAGALDADLTDGLLRSARLVLDRQVQIAANQIARVDDRYTQLTNSVASSCRICEGQAPTWQIRARDITYDDVGQWLYMDGARFELWGLPVAYFPRLRLPTPERERATGFLIPSLRSTSQLGLGIKTPLFVTLGPSADLLLEPYLSPETETLAARYRQAFRRGDIAFEAAITDDTIRPGETRFLFLGEGQFDAPRDFTLDFSIEEVSDEAYLVDYDYSDQDRLTTELRLSRTRRSEIITGALTDFETLRDEETPIADELPSRVAAYGIERRARIFGGELRYGIEANALYRESAEDRLGRDTASLNFDAMFLRRDVLPAGLVATQTVGLGLSGYDVSDDDRFDGTLGRAVPEIATELRLPMARAGDGGAQLLLEPVAQIAYAPELGDEVPNEDSLLVEFDEGNLLALSRFPGQDAVETGLRANLGVSFTAVGLGGITVGASAGRVLRLDADTGFTDGSGLAGTTSDWLAAGRITLGTAYEFTTRALFDDSGDVRKNETRLAYDGGPLDFIGTYVWLDAEPRENRFDDINEFTTETAYRFARNWIGSVSNRYDLVADRTAEAAFGLEYRTECIRVAAEISRRFTGTEDVEPSTDFGIGLELAGFGSDRFDDSYRKSCRG